MLACLDTNGKELSWNIQRSSKKTVINLTWKATTKSKSPPSGRKFAPSENTQKPAGKPAVAATPTNKVLAFMKRYKKGVSISKLKEGSGLSDKQISNILHRASKEGKIKRVARGVYKLA